MLNCSSEVNLFGSCQGRGGEEAVPCQGRGGIEECLVRNRTVTGTAGELHYTLIWYTSE